MKYGVYGAGRAGRVHAKIYQISYSENLEEFREICEKSNLLD